MLASCRSCCIAQCMLVPRSAITVILFLPNKNPAKSETFVPCLRRLHLRLRPSLRTCRSKRLSSRSHALPTLTSLLPPSHASVASKCPLRSSAAKARLTCLLDTAVIGLCVTLTCCDQRFHFFGISTNRYSFFS